MNNQETLFKMFIFAFLDGNAFAELEDIDTQEFFDLCTDWRQPLWDLFPRENCPVEYEGFTGCSENYYNEGMNTFLLHTEEIGFENKIKFYFTDENKQEE